MQLEPVMYGFFALPCLTRLQVGLPATIEHRKRPAEGNGGGARAVAETVQHFITAMDSLKLNLVAVDQVCVCVHVYIWDIPKSLCFETSAT